MRGRWHNLFEVGGYLCDVPGVVPSPAARDNPRLWDGIPLGFGNGGDGGRIISKVTFGYIYRNFAGFSQGFRIRRGGGFRDVGKHQCHLPRPPSPIPMVVGNWQRPMIGSSNSSLRMKNFALGSSRFHSDNGHFCMVFGRM